MGFENGKFMFILLCDELEGFKPDLESLLISHM
jgi:hypothetical protein